MTGKPKLGADMNERQISDLVNKIILMEHNSEKNLALILSVCRESASIRVLNLDKEEKQTIKFFDIIDGNVSFRVIQ